MGEGWGLVSTSALRPLPQTRASLTYMQFLRGLPSATILQLQSEGRGAPQRYLCIGVQSQLYIVFFKGLCCSFKTQDCVSR